MSKIDKLIKLIESDELKIDDKVELLDNSVDHRGIYGKIRAVKQDGIYVVWSGGSDDNVEIDGPFKSTELRKVSVKIK